MDNIYTLAPLHLKKEDRIGFMCEHAKYMLRREIDLLVKKHQNEMWREYYKIARRLGVVYEPNH